MDLPLAVALQETASLPTEGHYAGEPSPICLIIIHTCEDDFLKHSLFGLMQLPCTITVNLALVLQSSGRIVQGLCASGSPGPEGKP